jgi:hypothetical protein
MAGFAMDVPIDLSVDGEDLFPEDEEKQRELVSYVQRKFKMAQQARAPHEARWLTYYKAYRSFVTPRKTGQWRSQTWMPISFYVIETVLPRLCASLPSATVNPVGPEDVDPAETMEELLHWAEDKSELFPQMVASVKDSLMYGTGILKVGYGEKKGFNIVDEPLMEQTTVSVATGEADIDGTPMMQEMPGEPTPKLDAEGNEIVQTVREEYITYAGPIAESVDLENFFPDPMGDDVPTCRFVIHRVYRDAAHIRAKIKDGTYRVPDREDWRRYLDNKTTNKALQRLAEIDRGGGEPSEEGLDKDLFPLLEFHTKDYVVTVAGEDAEGILLRAIRNPFAHGEIPFIRVVDHIVPHEFFGVGELEPLEGIQDQLNAIWNARLDNIKLTLNKMYAVVADYMMDPNELVNRPGGVVRFREGLPLEQVFREIDMGEVTGAAYTEAAELMKMGDQTLGTNPYMTGQDSPAYNRTATGAGLISEQANVRFSFKVTLAEHTGYKQLMRQYASVLQQFLPDDLVLRMKQGEVEKKQQAAALAAQQAGMQVLQMGGDEMMAQQQAMGVMQQMMTDPITGMPYDPMNAWKQISQDSINGRFDFDIEAESSTQTLSMRREQTLSLAQTAMPDPYFKPRPIREDLLKEFGRKDAERYLYSDMDIQMMQQAAQQQEQEQAPEEESVGATQ